MTTIHEERTARARAMQPSERLRALESENAILRAQVDTLFATLQRVAAQVQRTVEIVRARRAAPRERR